MNDNMGEVKMTNNVYNAVLYGITRRLFVVAAGTPDVDSQPELLTSADVLRSAI